MNDIWGKKKRIARQHPDKLNNKKPMVMSFLGDSNYSAPSRDC